MPVPLPTTHPSLPEASNQADSLLLGPLRRILGTIPREQHWALWGPLDSGLVFHVLAPDPRGLAWVETETTFQDKRLKNPDLSLVREAFKREFFR